MFTKMKVKKYLSTKEEWTLFDEVLHFYTSIHLKEVFKFWGLTNIQMSIDWNNNQPILLHVHAKYRLHPLHLVFAETDLSSHENQTQISLNYSNFNTINDLFDALREQLEQ